MNAKSTSEQFVKLLAAREFKSLARIFAPDARARYLLPHGLEEYRGGDAIVRRIESWFGPASELTLDLSSVEAVGRRQRLSWRFSLRRGGGPAEVIEQLAFLDVGDGGIEQLDLLCSGFMAASTAHVFDAGAMGCADGLAQEFRRQLSEVPVGESLQVVVRDPAAREDLPALARLLGQTVTSVEAHDDGRLAINVERIR